MAHAGFDWLCVDMQHGIIDYTDAVDMLRAISQTDTMPFVRVEWNEPWRIMKVLDAGAYGVIVPLVNNREEAERAVWACRYPPIGGRSSGPARAAMYGGANYAAESNDEIAVICMIETAEALENLDDILSVDGVDCAYIGPSDLAYALDITPTGDNSDPRHGGDYIKSGFVTDISGAQINAIVDGFEGHPDRSTTFFYGHSGGAINRVAENATAFPNRNAVCAPMIVVAWNEGADPEPHIDYIRSYWPAVEKFTDGFYTNTGDFETQSNLDKNYRGNHKRLVELKNQYDPSNLFRLNANVRPSTDSA
jgi:hypothetical protein